MKGNRFTLFLFLSWRLIFPIAHAADYTTLFEQSKTAIGTILIYSKKNEPLSQGTGFFIAPNGTLITNRHVMKGAYSASVTLHDGSTFPITRIMEEDANRDILKAKAELSGSTSFLDLEILEPNPGEEALVIGTPVGLDFSFSSGNVSNVRDHIQFSRVIQFSSPISSGSSGSPVLNKFGKVMGVATFSRVDGEGLNFAIPAYYLTKMTNLNMPVSMWGKFNPEEKEPESNPIGKDDPEETETTEEPQEPELFDPSDPKNEVNIKAFFTYSSHTGSIPSSKLIEFNSILTKDFVLISIQKHSNNLCLMKVGEEYYDECERNFATDTYVGRKTIVDSGKCPFQIAATPIFSLDNNGIARGEMVVQIEGYTCNFFTFQKFSGLLNYSILGEKTNKRE